jgi:hypothetical protein
MEETKNISAILDRMFELLDSAKSGVEVDSSESPMSLNSRSDLSSSPRPLERESEQKPMISFDLLAAARETPQILEKNTKVSQAFARDQSANVLQ